MLKTLSSFEENFKCGMVYCNKSAVYTVHCNYCDEDVKFNNFQKHFHIKHFSLIKQDEPQRSLRSSTTATIEPESDKDVDPDPISTTAPIKCDKEDEEEEEDDNSNLFEDEVPLDMVGLEVEKIVPTVTEPIMDASKSTAIDDQEGKSDGSQSESNYSDDMSESNNSSNKNVGNQTKKVFLLCKMCPFKFETKVGLVVHMKSKHKDKIPSLPKKRKRKIPTLETMPELPQMPEEPAQTEPVQPSKFECGHCDMEFQLKYKLFAHIAIAHNPSSPNDATIKIIADEVVQPNEEDQTKPQEEQTKHQEQQEGAGSLSTKSRSKRNPQFVCDLCNESFCQENLLICHIVRVHNNNTCDFCGKTYKSSSATIDHRMSHSGEKNFKCTDCDEKFITRGQMRAHLASHRPTKISICHICGENCLGRNKYLRHMRRHAGDRPFKCRICGKRFFEAFDRTLHESGHSDEKPYPCEICGRSFRNTKAVRIHKKIHVKERNFACTLCNKRFINEKGLKEHSRVHERVETLVEKEEIIEQNMVEFHAALVPELIYEELK